MKFLALLSCQLPLCRKYHLYLFLLSLGERCDVNTCQHGYVCGAQRRCVLTARFHIDAIGAYDALPVVGATPLVGYDSETTDDGIRGEWSFEGPCDDLFGRVISDGVAYIDVLARLRTFPWSSGMVYKTMVKGNRNYRKNDVQGMVVNLLKASIP